MKRKQRDVQRPIQINVHAGFRWCLDTWREGESSQTQMFTWNIVGELTSAANRLMQREPSTEPEVKMIYTFYVHVQVMWYAANKENTFVWRVESPWVDMFRYRTPSIALGHSLL